MLLSSGEDAETQIGKILISLMKSEMEAVDPKNYQFKIGRNMEILRKNLWRREVAYMCSIKTSPFPLTTEMDSGYVRSYKL